MIIMITIMMIFGSVEPISGAIKILFAESEDAVHVEWFKSPTFLGHVGHLGQGTVRRQAFSGL